MVQQFDVRSQENPAQASGDDCILQVPPEIQKSQNWERSIGKVTFGCQKKYNSLLQDATSLKIPVHKHRGSIAAYVERR